jgi:hypothetical protein
MTDLLTMLRVWRQVPRTPEPSEHTDPLDLPNFDIDPTEAPTPDEIEKEFNDANTNALGERWDR